MIAVASNDPRSRRSLSTVTSNSARPAAAVPSTGRSSGSRHASRRHRGWFDNFGSARHRRECLVDQRLSDQELHPELTRDFVEDVPRKDQVVVLEYFFVQLGAGSRTGHVRGDQHRRIQDHSHRSLRTRKTSSSVLMPRAWARATSSDRSARKSVTKR